MSALDCSLQEITNLSSFKGPHTQKRLQRKSDICFQAAVERTTKTTADSQLTCTFCARMRENYSQ